MQVGDLINSQDDIDALPVGAEICVVDNEDEFYIKTEDGWEYGSGGRYGGSFAMHGHNKVSHLPPASGTEQVFVESLGAYKIRFRETVLLAQRNNGVSMDPINRAFRALGVDEDSLPPGAGMKVRWDRSHRSLPRETIVEVGTPDHYETYGQFVNSVRGWQPIVGGAAGVPHRAIVTVLRYGINGYSEPEWVANDTTDPEAIAEFQALAYDQSRKTKGETQWCGVVEQTMRALGITATSARRSFPFVLDVDAADLPAGSILLWESDDKTEWQVFIRDNNYGNQSRTRCLFGHRRGTRMRHSQRRMQTVFVNDGRADSFNLPLDLRSFFESVPRGVMFSHMEETTQGYIVTAARDDEPVPGRVAIYGLSNIDTARLPRPTDYTHWDSNFASYDTIYMKRVLT